MVRENPQLTIVVAYLSHAAGLVALVGFNILVFQQFSLEEVGTYNFILSIIAFVGFALDMGISQTLIRGFSQNALSFAQALTGSVALRLPVVLLGLGILAGWLWFGASQWKLEVQLLILAILSQICMGLRTIPTAWLRARDRQNIANIISALQPLGYFAIGLFLMYNESFHILYFFGGILLVEMAATGFAFWTIQPLPLWSFAGRTLTFAYVQESLACLWRPSLIFMVVTFWAVIQSRLDWILVYAFGSKTSLAYYSLANKVYELFESGICVLIHTSFPWMCKMAATGERDPKMIMAFKGIAFIGMVLALAAALWAPRGLSIFWGDKFAAANNLIFFLMVAACLNPTNSLLYYLFIAAGKEKYLLITSTLPALAQLAANLLLIPQYGGSGALVGMVILISSSFVLLSIISWKIRLTEYLDVMSIAVISLVLWSALVFLHPYVRESTLYAGIFLVASGLAGFLWLFSSSERALLRGDIKAILASLTAMMGKIVR